MTDVFSKQKRSWVMSRIRGTDTNPELKVRSFLHALGFRYRLHDRRLPGKPDIVLPKYRTVILVHGCFWHGHRGCAKGRHRPQSHVEFWQRKIEDNARRDRIAVRRLRKLGWSVFTLWECGFRRSVYLDKSLRPLIEQRRL